MENMCVDLSKKAGKKVPAFFVENSRLYNLNIILSFWVCQMHGKHREMYCQIKGVSQSVVGRIRTPYSLM